MDEKLNNIEGLTLNLLNLANIDLMLNDLDSAKSKALKSYNLCAKFNLIDRQLNVGKLLSDILKEQGKHVESLKYLGWYVDTKDSLLSENVTKRIQELEAKYQNEKDAAEINELKLEKSLQSKEIHQKEIEEYFLLIGLILVLAMLGIGVYAFVQKRKSNDILFKSNFLVKEKNEELNQQNEEILAQRDEIDRQREALQIKNHDVQESINAAERIQLAFFQSEEREKALLPPHFVVFKPRDVVSGDFYWSHIAEEKGKKFTYISVVDCTGHGIPGAVMSMLGLSLIKEVMNKTISPTPAQLLDNLRKFLIRELSQEGKESSVKEGMDMSIIRIDQENHEILYAGANNPVYLSDGNEVVIYKADKQSISFHEEPKPYTNKKIEYDKGNMIYLFSDGYADQFGGPSNKKIGYKKFRNLLEDISNLEINDQQTKLEDFFKSWQGDEDQIDDVCLIGMKLN